MFVTWIAEAKLLNIMSRSMFLLPTKHDEETAQEQKGKFDHGRKMMAKKCFAYYYLFFKCFCCCRTKEFKEQQKFIDKAGAEVDRQTDLLTLIRQKNMAAKTIWVLASKNIRTTLAEATS